MKSFFSCSTMARLLLLLSIPATMLIDPIDGQPGASHDVHHQHRRSPMGFQGVRGKRSSGGGEAINNFQHSPHSPDYYPESSGVVPSATESVTVTATSPGGSLSSVGSESLIPMDQIHVGVAPDSRFSSYLGKLSSLSVSKRAPVSGFWGMRGKKDYELPEQTLSFETGFPEQEQPLRSSEEESPPPLFGEGNNRVSDDSYYGDGSFSSDFEDSPRNKKLFFNLPYRFIPKRTPSSFMSKGTRGKKFLVGSFKRGPSGFMGMRGKKSYNSPLIDLLRESMELNDVGGDFSPDTAAGLSDYEDEGRFADEFEKRGPSGFFGMRGKKWNDLIDSYSVRYSDQKRAPKMGFHGMRGKRSADPYYGASKSGAGGGSNYGYFSVMKKVPYEFRGKFVGVRGKKSRTNYLDDEMQSEFEKRNPNGPSGFFGMRGKKST